MKTKTIKIRLCEAVDGCDNTRYGHCELCGKDCCQHHLMEFDGYEHEFGDHGSIACCHWCAPKVKELVDLGNKLKSDLQNAVNTRMNEEIGKVIKHPMGDDDWG